MLISGSCHCGNIAFEVEGEIKEVMACNCSMCSRKGSLLWFVPRAKLRLALGETPAKIAQREAAGSEDFIAALDELTASRERKTFLDAQNADLMDAIGTLESAIHKIDLETRDLLDRKSVV